MWRLAPLLVVLAACDRIGPLPTGDDVAPPSAEVALAPGLTPVTADFVGWNTGAFSCGVGLPGGVREPGDPPVPIRIEIWSGIEDPCTEEPPPGSWVVVLELSDSLSGTYTVAQACVGPLTAFAGFGEVTTRAGQPALRQAEDGSVSLAFLGFDRGAFAEGTFSFVLPGEDVPVTGTFLAAFECL